MKIGLIEQLNLFGEAVAVDELNQPKPSRKYKTMQETHGINPNHICKDCKHLVKLQYSKAYYKCVLWRLSHSTATDIRVKKTACAKFELRQGAIKVYAGG